MTTAKKGILTVLAGLALPLLVPVAISFGTAAYTVGQARLELSGKEDRAMHVSDMRDLTDSLREERRVRQLQRVADSAFRVQVLDRITDVACDRQPKRRYCGERP